MERTERFTGLDRLNNYNSFIIRKFAAALQDRYEGKDMLVAIEKTVTSEEQQDTLVVLLEDGIEVIKKDIVEDGYQEDGRLAPFDVEISFIPYREVTAVKEVFVDINSTDTLPSLVQVTFKNREPISVNKNNDFNHRYSKYETRNQDCIKFVDILKRKITK
ncbi:hypothetical protein [Rossellomorea aquimaris]|uniref:hypothetical protein n=1 Tax=Rossellomorea aquimaris TaxID=189382 RepID=UPI0011E8BAD8|nr:hypothetical protein [Rossellomorea aquimaris]TYS88982.1 hypothetical protein FZC88_13025 [Rossellomorea aquimaris]